MGKRHFIWLVPAAALLLLNAPNAVDAQGQQAALVLQGGTLIDGNGGAPIANAVVVVEGNRIIAVGQAGQVQIPNGAQIIDAAGKWVLPGLMDAKGNWNWQYGEPYLNWGNTSNFVTGPRNDQGLADRDAVLHGVFAGPRNFQGIMGMQGPGADGDRPDNFTPGGFNRIHRTAEDNLQAARTYLENGADFIVWTDGDGPPEVFEPAVRDVLRQGKAVVFRAMGPQTRAREVCEMGDGIVYIHTGNPGTQMAVDEDKWARYIALPPDAYADMDDAKMNAMVEQLVGCNAYLEPDLMATAKGFHRSWDRVIEETEAFFDDPDLMTYYPQHSVNGVMENLRPATDYLNDEEFALRAAGFRNQMRFLKAYVDAGGKIVAASDTPQTAPGLGLHQEMTAFVEDVGLTPMQAILSATKWVAEGFKQPDLGVIEAGKLADIIVVDADPLRDIKNLRQISTVIFDGKPVELGYHPWYRGGMFARPDTDQDGIIADTEWVAAVKAATWRPNRLHGGFGNAGGFESFASPPPAIEAISLHTVIRKSPDTPLTITGFNYVKGSVAYYDGIAIPTEAVSQTELRITIPENLLGRAGNFPIVVKNPMPVATNMAHWGNESNAAWLLVPFEFTTKWSHNQY